MWLMVTTGSVIPAPHPSMLPTLYLHCCCNMAVLQEFSLSGRGLDPCFICAHIRAGVSGFVAEFVKRKAQELSRKAGGGGRKKNKKGAAAASSGGSGGAAATGGGWVAAPAAPLPLTTSGGVSAAAVGMVGGGADASWNKIPKKASGGGAAAAGGKAGGGGGKKGGKGSKVDPSLLGFTSKLDIALLQDE